MPAPIMSSRPGDDVPSDLNVSLDGPTTANSCVASPSLVLTVTMEEPGLPGAVHSNSMFSAPVLVPVVADQVPATELVSFTVSPTPTVVRVSGAPSAVNVVADVTVGAAPLRDTPAVAAPCDEPPTS